MHTEFNAKTIGTRVKRGEDGKAPEGVLLSMNDATGNTLLVRLPWAEFDEALARFTREKAVETARTVAPIVTAFLDNVDERLKEMKDQASIAALDIYQAFGITASDVRKAQGPETVLDTEKELHAAAGRSVGDSLAV